MVRCVCQYIFMFFYFYIFFFFQAEDGIRDLVRSRGLGDVYKRQAPTEEQKNDGVLLGKAVVEHLRQRAEAVKETDPDLSLIHI